MIRKIAIVGVTCAAVVGTGATALAATGTTSGSGAPASSNASAHRAAAKQYPRLRHLLARFGVHGEIVTNNGDGGFVTHDGIRGTVTDVSATEITVKAADGYTLSFTVSDSTKVRVRANGRGGAGSIGDVSKGDSVGVVGKHAGSGSGEPTATVIVDGIKR